MMGCRSCTPSTTIITTSEARAGQLAARRERRGLEPWGGPEFVLFCWRWVDLQMYLLMFDTTASNVTGPSESAKPSFIRLASIPSA